MVSFLRRNLVYNAVASKETVIPPGVLESKWVYGITPPETSDWKRLLPTMYYNYSLKYNEKYGWFDVKKQNPTATPGGVEDGYMCWAAGASNMLHWWLKMNDSYIQQYGKYTGPSWQLRPTPQESEIFQYFVDSFPNLAGYEHNGVNWFINQQNEYIDPAPDSPDIPHAFFSEVIPSDVKLSTMQTGLGKESFKNYVREALDSKKALGITYGPVKGSHDITMWGAEFDADGYVKYVYLCDNNDRDDFEFWGVGIVRHEVTYIPFPEGGEGVYIKDGLIDNDINRSIIKLYTTDLGTEYWKKYLGISE